ncbi:MAG: universal stress protein [Deltaproteobacteria bacterium]|nr:universal stress protein [Deltaproteobacteria bacterium]
MDTTQKKILVAIDGSSQSLDAVRYISKVIAPQNTKVALFHVLKKIDEAFWEIGIDPAFSRRMASIAAWELERNNAAKEFMDCSRRILFGAQFVQDAVEVNIHQSKTGVARDIIKESMNGYCAVVVGRKGLSKLKDLVLGSIAQKLVEKISHVPVWVVGGNPRVGKVLLALDASEGAMKGVDHVGAMLGKSDYEVVLLHVIREVNSYSWLREGEGLIPSKLTGDTDVKWLEDVRMEMGPVFDEARTRLINAGFDANRVTTKFITNAGSRAGAIVEEAQEGGYGTIVVGRRGLSKVQEFFMGRVSNKVLHLAKDMAVWIVD